MLEVLETNRETIPARIATFVAGTLNVTKVNC